MKPILKLLPLLLLSSEALAGVTIDRVTVIDWETREKTYFYDCSVAYWNSLAKLDRDANDANYLYAECQDMEGGSIGTGETSTYERQGVSYDEIGLGFPWGYRELTGGCFMTRFSSGQETPAPDTEAVIECPESAFFKSGFEHG